MSTASVSTCRRRPCRCQTFANKLKYVPWLWTTSNPTSVVSLARDPRPYPVYGQPAQRTLRTDSLTIPDANHHMNSPNKHAHRTNGSRTSHDPRAIRRGCFRCLIHYDPLNLSSHSRRQHEHAAASCRCPWRQRKYPYQSARYDGSVFGESP